jgi:hypothetical protein
LKPLERTEATASSYGRTDSAALSSCLRLVAASIERGDGVRILHATGALHILAQAHFAKQMLARVSADDRAVLASAISACEGEITTAIDAYLANGSLEMLATAWTRISSRMMEAAALGEARALCESMKRRTRI